MALCALENRCRAAYGALVWGSSKQYLKAVHVWDGNLREGLSFGELCVRRRTMADVVRQMTAPSLEYVVVDTNTRGDATSVDWKGCQFKLEVRTVTSCSFHSA